MIARALVNKTIANASPTMQLKLMSTGRLKLSPLVSSLIICLSSDNMMAKTIGIY